MISYGFRCWRIFGLSPNSQYCAKVLSRSLIYLYVAGRKWEMHFAGKKWEIVAAIYSKMQIYMKIQYIKQKPYFFFNTAWNFWGKHFCKLLFFFFDSSGIHLQASWRSSSLNGLPFAHHVSAWWYFQMVLHSGSQSDGTFLSTYFHPFS